VLDVRLNRYVATYTPGDWPAGVLTGYDDEAGGWHLEHVIAFDRNGGTLRALMRHGLAEAWARDFQYVTFHIPHAFPLHGALAAIGGGLGFKEYSRDERHVYYVCHRPQAAEAGPALAAEAAGTHAGG
jgi:hypothetical protein